MNPTGQSWQRKENGLESAGRFCGVGEDERWNCPTKHTLAQASVDKCSRTRIHSIGH